MLKLVSSQNGPLPSLALLSAAALEAADDGDTRTARIAVAAIRNRFPECRAFAGTVEAQIGRASHLQVVS